MTSPMIVSCLGCAIAKVARVCLHKRCESETVQAFDGVYFRTPSREPRFGDDVIAIGRISIPIPHRSQGRLSVRPKSDVCCELAKALDARHRIQAEETECGVFNFLAKLLKCHQSPFDAHALSVKRSVRATT